MGGVAEGRLDKPAISEELERIAKLPRGSAGP